MDGKRERFKRVATRRTNEVLKKMAILGNCANKSAYEYTDEEISKIFNEIEKALKLTRMKFHIAKDSKEEFKL